MIISFLIRRRVDDIGLISSSNGLVYLFVNLSFCAFSEVFGWLLSLLWSGVFFIVVILT